MSMQDNDLFLSLSDQLNYENPIEPFYFQKTKVTLAMKLNFTLALLLITMAVSIQAQQKKDYRKLHYLTEEEMNTPLNIKDFVPTPPPEGFIRNVAEFDRMQAVLVRYPFGIPVSLIKEMADDIRVLTVVANESQKQSVINQYTSGGVNLDSCDFLIAPTNSYWTRDYGPWFIFDGNKEPGIVDFPYNRPRPADDEIPVKVAQYLNINLFGMDVIHTGGNYMCDGMGKAASTDLVADENNITEQEIKNRLKNYLGIDDYFILEDPLHEYIKHIDCWGKFLAPDKVLIGQVAENDWRYEDYEAVANFFATHNSSYGEPYKVYRVFTPGSPKDTPYTNSLILNKKVLVPITGSQWDDDALEAYKQAMPGYEVIGVQYWDWMNTDALHCRTKGIADLKQLYIWHVPVVSQVNYKQSYPLSATLYNYSGQPVYQDSVFVIYKINQSGYDTLLMQETDAVTNTYSISLSGVLPGDTVRYYLYAADHSGHRASHPFIGRPDPHIFVVKKEGLMLDPDTLVFADIDDGHNGILMNLINPSEENIEIKSIDQYGNLNWYIEDSDMPGLPYLLASGDTLSIPVYYAFPVRDQWFYDSLHIVAGDSTYVEIIQVDSLLTVIDRVDTDKELNVKVFPVPFDEHVTFSWQQKSDYLLKIYDLSGKKVFEKKGSGLKVIWNPGSLNGHLFLYKLFTGGKEQSGKVLRKR
jgi:agmatine/peptidylarginine deiminase